MRERRLGDYGPSPREVIETIGHPTPVPPVRPLPYGWMPDRVLPPTEVDDGPLTERCPDNHGLHETDVEVPVHYDENVSLFIDILTPGAIYLVKRPYQSKPVPEPMYLRTYQDDIAQFQDMNGERLTMGTNLVRQSIQKRYTTKDMLEALARLV